MCAVFHTNFISYVVVVVVVSLTEEIINFDSKQFCTEVEEEKTNVDSNLSSVHYNKRTNGSVSYKFCSRLTCATHVTQIPKHIFVRFCTILANKTKQLHDSRAIQTFSYQMCPHESYVISSIFFLCVFFSLFFSVLFRTVDCFLWINFKRILIQTQVARLQNEYTIKQSRTKMFKRGRTTKINCTIKKNNVFFFSMKYEISMREWDFRICRTSTSVVLCSMWRPNTKSNERNNIFFL